MKQRQIKSEDLRASPIFLKQNKHFFLINLVHFSIEQNLHPGLSYILRSMSIIDFLSK